MSACGDFAEHVWKPGSCKNCFHPFSAHKTVGVLDGSAPPACLKSSLGGDEEAGVTSPSPYSKPTIAVKPTMMSLDTNESADLNMNIEQVSYLNVFPVCTSFCLDICIWFLMCEGRGSQSLKKNANEDSCRQQNSVTTIRTKSTYNGSVVTTRANYQESHQASVEIPLSADIVPSCPTTNHSNGVSSGRSGGRPDRSGSPQSPPAMGSPLSTPNSPSGQKNSEPIYAESTKKKRRPQQNGLQSNPESPNKTKQSQCSELELSGESQRATITVMAAHTEENNRTFYLSSPDSAVSTQSFRWPSPSHSAPSLAPESCLTPTLHTKPQSSPPIPPKRNIRSPKLGTSSLSPSMSSPVPLPELPRLGTSSLSPSMSSPVPLPELPMLFLVSAREGHFKVPTENQSAASERWHKPHHHSSAWNCRIEEEEEEEERERKDMEKKKLAANAGTTSRVTGLLNGAAVWKESKDWKAHSSPPPMTEPGTAPPICRPAHVIFPSFLGSRDASRLSCSSPFPRSPVASAPGSPHPPSFNSLGNQPPPLPEKKMVNRTVSAPDSANGKAFIRAYPRLPFTGSETNVCRSADLRSSLPSSPVDPRPIFSSNESLERCHAPLGRSSRSRTLDEPFKTPGRLGVHCRSSITCSSSPQLSAPFSSLEPGSAPNLGSSLQLQTLLSNIDSREGVYSKLGGLYAESLRRLALKCEDHFTRSQRNPLRFEESNWSLFRLTSNKPSCNAGDAVYYSAACASDPSNSYAVKICKSPSVDAKQGHLYSLSVQQSMPPHFNLQQDCGHFLACVPQSMLPFDEVSLPTTPASSLPQPSTSVQQVDRERVVVITPEIPQQTAVDFVREWEMFHKTQPEVYERRVCFLLLQLCNGLEHLKEHGVTHRDLCLENLLLVPHQRRPSQFTQQTSTDKSPSNGSGIDIQRHLPRLLISNFAKAKRRSSEDTASTSVDPRIKRDHARLAPEIVSAAQYRKFDEFQTGILIYELLHQPNPFEVSPALKEQDYRCEDLPPVPSVSLYSAGLQRLAQLLLQPDPIKRIHIQEAKRILQSLLWGPRKDLMEQQWERHGQGGSFVDGSRHEGLLNWLDVKRALLMMKFAERSLEPERNAELEDWLCCQYFSSAHPLSLCHTAELLYSLK
uniref:Inactive tyrosine-protein kinase PEAK1 n=1 Tax=Amphiprion percula TaxID=161767 RepID=A0A3P8TEK8_AMPPE